MKCCFIQEICQHYLTGDNKPNNHDVRNKYPCKRWLAMDCEKMPLLAELGEYATGTVMMCDLAKIKRIREAMK